MNLGNKSKEYAGKRRGTSGKIQIIMHRYNSHPGFLYHGREMGKTIIKFFVLLVVDSKEEEVGRYYIRGRLSITQQIQYPTTPPGAPP